MAKQALLPSIRAQFAEKIFSGTKRVELRRRRPKIGPGDLVFVYVPSPAKAVQGAFEVKEVISGSPATIWQRFAEVAGITKIEFDAYFQERECGCAIVIGRIWRLSKPVKLEQLRKERQNFHPPQSFHYKCPNDFSRSIGFQLPTRSA